MLNFDNVFSRRWEFIKGSGARVSMREHPFWSDCHVPFFIESANFPFCGYAWRNALLVRHLRACIGLAGDGGAISMTYGDRKSDRVRFEHFSEPVNLVSIDGTWRRQCLLRDVSSTGARLEIDGATDVFQAKEFFLLLSATGAAFRRCELVWINGLTVGVRFILERDKKKLAKTGH
jgi:hypothetical protein